MSRTTPLVFFWAIGASIFFLIIAILFMKNQVRPIKELAEASDRFGRGLETVELKPHGASEVRQAALAFRRMQERIKKQITQRTEMLAGISHDLRTPLTRMKLELALLPGTIDTEPLKKDIDHMETMIQEYLAFVRGDPLDAPVPFALHALIESLQSQWATLGLPVEYQGPKDVEITGRPQAIKRVLDNLLSNAKRFATQAWVSVEERPQEVLIKVEDNGPGIPPEHRQDVLKPFFRLEGSRNTETGGIGLGLSIVADSISNHGGQLTLDDSPHGGLRVTLLLPR